MKPAAGGPGAIAASAAGSTRRRASTWGVLRVSAQMMAGRRGAPSAPSRTVPCIWPERPIPAMRAGSAPEAAIASRTVATAASHQAAGSCSAQPGRGCWIVCSRSAAARTRADSASRTMLLIWVVPRSMPIRRDMRLSLGIGTAPDYTAGGL